MHTAATEMGKLAMLSCGRLAHVASHSSGVMPSASGMVGIVNGGGMACFALRLLRRKVTSSSDLHEIYAIEGSAIEWSSVCM